MSEETELKKPTHVETIAIARDGVAISNAVLQEKNGAYEIGFTGNVASSLAPQIEALRAFVAEASPEKEKKRDEVWSKFKGLLKSDGFEVSVVPLPTFQMNLSVDAEWGRILAPPSRLVQGSGNLDESLEASIFAGVGRALRSTAAEPTTKIRAAVAEGRHADAARALIDGTDLLTLAFGADELRAAANLIDVDALAPREAAEVLQRRVAIAAKLGRRDAAMGADVALLLTRFRNELPPERVSSLEIAQGLVALEAGKREVAFSHWKCAVERRDHLSLGDRAWAYRNLSMLLDTVEPDAARYAELSAGAFLASGNRREAAKSTGRLVDCTLADAPEEALRRLDDVLAWFVGDDPHTKDGRAAILHRRADALIRLHRPAEALEAAKRATEERANLRGSEASRAASLTLASEAAAMAGKPEEAAALGATAKVLRAQCEDPADLRVRLRLAMEGNDLAAVDLVRVAAATAGDTIVEAHALMLLGTRETDPQASLERFEEALGKLRAANAPDGDIVVAELAVGERLLTGQELRRALPYFERILRLDPLHAAARGKYASILWKLKEWRAAATYMEKELERFPDRPGIICALGRSLLEAGDQGRAIPYLVRASRLAPEGSDTCAQAEAYLSRALESGARAEPELPEPPPRPVTRSEFEACLAELRDHVQAAMRMNFWVTEGKGKKWAASPERVAQNIVRTFLAAKFGDRIHVFEEIDCGAGRLDVYVLGAGGFSAILELKMLGQPYTTAYAFSGKEQIVHYMEQKKCHLGYLLIFDGRARDFGKGLKRLETVRESTVLVSFIDLRTSVKGVPEVSDDDE